MSDQSDKHHRRPRRRLLVDEDDDEDEVEQLHKQNHNRLQRNNSHYENNSFLQEKDPRKVAQGSIVHKTDEDDEEDDPQMSRKSKKRKESLDEDLDEDDLALVEENTGVKIQRPERFKRLKKRRQDYGSSDDNNDDNELEQEPSRKNHDPLARIFDAPVDDYEDNSCGRGRDSDDDMDFIDDEESDGDDDRDIIDHERKRKQQAAARKTAPQGSSILHSYNEEMNEWHGVFGDGEDYAYALSKENGEVLFNDPPSETHLKDVFEPGVLAEKMLTHADDILRLKDVPERMQMRPGIKTDRKLTDLEIELEAYWVTTALNDNHRRIDRPSFDSMHIQSVLKFMSQELLEVPFIDLHCKDYFTRVHGHRLTRLLSREDLWFIYDEDFKFRSFLERKEAIGALVDRMHIRDEYLNYSLLRAERLDELTDISDYINLRYSKKVDEANTSLLRRPGSAGAFDLQEREHLSTFISTLGMTTREFGINLSEGKKKFFPKDDKSFPEQAAGAYVRPGIASPQQVISMAVGMMTQEVAVDPLVRRAIRTKYETEGCVTVIPTEKGVSTIDELHPYYPFKRLTQKNVREFRDGQFLRILQAQSEGLLKVEIKIPDKDRYIQSISDYYLSNGQGDKTRQWNALRTKILSSALKKHIFVIVERGMIEKLRVQAEEWVGSKCQAALEERMNIAPFMVPGTAESEEVLPRVVAISHGPGSVKDAIQVVYVDDKGRFIEHKKLDNLRDRTSQEELLDLLERRHPDVVVVGGFSVATRRLLEQTESVVREHRDSNGDQVSVIMTNDEVAKLYQSSKRGVEDHPKAYEITRYCISLARTIQSPINEYAATGVDLIGIRLHPLQEFVGADRLRELLDRALVNVINDVGVDINEVVSSPYKALMLPYICGLGTRKAQHLIRIIERDPVTRGVDKRSDMVNRKMLTWNIFMNCCSFLRVHTERGGDILDQTRIHFQDYNLARKMAADALEIDEVGLQEYDEESQHVEELMRDDNAERLNELLLDDYAHQLQNMQQKPKRMTLEHIKAELQHPFRDHRTQFVPATPDQIFTMLTGETDQTLREGFIVPALVTKVREKNAMCRLDCGIDGILSIQNISDSRIGSVKDHVSEGQTLQVKILRLEKARFFADLTCKESELRQGDAHLRALPLDRTFDQFEEDRFKDPADPNDNKGGFVHRKIHHPLFKNITSEAAIKYLSTRNRGELVIRPSNRGADHLIITVKIADDIYKHYDVLEINKRDDISLGKVLQIDDSTYIDLDDLLVSHIEAILSRCHDLMSSPKYRENEYELRAWLEEQTRIRPDVAVYGFTLSRKYPGYFSLIFKLGHHAKIDEWNIKVLPSFFQLKGPSKRNCVDPTAISDNFKDMASKISHRNRTSKKPGNLPGSGSTPAFDSSSAHRNRSQSRHRNSISSNATSFSAQAKSRPPSDRGYSPGSNTNAHSASAAYDRSRSRPGYQNGDSNADSRFQDIGFDDYSFQDSDFPSFQSATRTNPNTSWNARGRSRPRHGYDDSNADTDNNYINSWNDRSKSKSRPGYGDRSAEVNTHGSWIDRSKSRPRPGYGDRNSHNNDGHIGTNTDNIPITSRSKSRSSYGDGDAHNGSNSNWDDRGRSRHRPGYNGADGASSAAWNSRGHSSYRSGEGDANNNRNASWSNRGRSSHQGGETNAADNRGRSRYRDGGGDVDNDRNTSWSNRGRSSYRSGDGNAADNRERSRYRGRDNNAVSSGDGSWGSRGRSSNRSGEATAAVNRGRPSYRGRNKNADSNGDGSWSNRGRSRHRDRDSNADGDNASWYNRGRSSHRSRDNDAENNSGAAWNNRGKSSYRGRDHNADSSTNSSWNDRSKSKPRYGYGNNNSYTSGQIGSSTNNIPVGSRAKSMARYGADASSGPSIPTTFSTGYGSSYQEAGTQDSSRPSYKSFAATSSQEPSMDFTAYSPEPMQATDMMKPAADLSFPQPSDFAAYYKEPAGAAASAVHGRRDSDQPMHSAVYSPEPKKPANSNVPPSARSSSLQPPDLKARSPEPEITEEYVRFLRVGHGASQPMDITAYSPESTKPEGSSKPAVATTARSYSPQPSTRSASSQLTVRSDSSQPTITSGSSQPPARSGSSQPTDFSAYSPEPMQATNPTRPTESTKPMPKPAANSTVKSGSPQAARAQAYSPELNGCASSVDTSDPSQPMDFTAYSPEPIELAVPPRTVTEAYKPWSSSSSATTGGGGYGGDEDDTGGISWGSGSYGGSSGGGGNRSHGGGGGDRSRSYGDNRQDERHGRFGDNGRSDNSSDRRPYQSPPPPPRQQQLQSNYGLGYGGKGQHHFEGDRESRPGQSNDGKNSWHKERRGGTPAVAQGGGRSGYGSSYANKGGDDDDDGGISWGSGSYGASGGGGGGGYGGYGNSGNSEYGDRGRSINKQGYGGGRSNDRNGGNGGGSRRESRPRSRSRRH